MSLFISSFLILLLSSFAAEDAKFIFEANGVVLKQYSRAEILDKVPQTFLKTYEPYEDSEKVYLGFEMQNFLKQIYGTHLLQADTVSLYCKDGYRSDIKIIDFKNKSLLAFAIKDSSKFSLKSAENKKEIDLGPYYLAWERSQTSDIKDRPVHWPYAVVKIDIINSTSAYAPLQPKKNSSTSVFLGQKAFMRHCISCHTLNGVGGKRGPALNIFVQLYSPQVLSTHILDPKSINQNSQMVGLPKDLKNRKQIAQDIINYLKAVSRTEQ